VTTPLWTDNPEVKDRFSIIDEISITSEKVAQSMIKLIEEEQYGSGTVYEISMLGERVIPAWNIDPPGMVDGKMGEGGGIPQAMVDKANGPLLAVTEKERGALLQ